ncbi:MAG: hypothetical protein ACK4UJ_10080 [Leptonema sp. (in: bacteria)]
MKPYFLYVLFAFFFFCSENFQDQIDKLEKEANLALTKQDKKKIIQIIEKLEDLELKYTKGKITQLNSIEEKKTLYYLTPSKKILFFSKEGSFYVLYKNQMNKINFKIPEEIISSFSGNYLVFVYKEKEICKNDFYNFNIQSIDNNKFIPEIKKIFEFKDDCLQKVITDNGRVFFLKNGMIYEKTSDTEALIIKKDQWKPIFKKNPHQIYLFPVPDLGFWIFYGNFGYYDLYYYNEKTLKQIFKGIATPKIFYAIQDLFGEDVFMEHYYFVVSGGVGEYSYTGFQLPDQIWKSINAPYRDDYIFIIHQNQFLFAEDGFLNLYNISTNKEVKLPIKVDSFNVYDGNIILLLNGKVFIRKEPFDAIEKKIFALKEDLYYNIR